ncbi:MAG: hypothetical protein ABFC89_07735 [Methanospirillum sp.]
MDAGGEEELYRFGPMGISVSTGRPGLFVWAQRNNTEIFLTDRRLYGRRTGPRLGRIFGGGDAPAFEVPLGEIVAIEPADFLANRAVWMRYRTQEGEKEVSIIASALCHGSIVRLMELLLPRVDKARGRR